MSINGMIVTWAYSIVALGLVIYGFIRFAIAHDYRSIIVEAICVAVALCYMFFLLWRYLPAVFSWQRNEKTFGSAVTALVRVNVNFVNFAKQRVAGDDPVKFPRLVMGLVADKDGISFWKPGSPLLLVELKWPEVRDVSVGSRAVGWRTAATLSVLLSDGDRLQFLICRPHSLGRGLADSQYVARLTEEVRRAKELV